MQSLISLNDFIFLFFGFHSKGMENKSKERWYCIKLKSFHTVKKTTTKNKRQPTEWERYSQIIHLVRSQYLQYRKNSYDSVTKQNKTKNPNYKMGRGTQTFFLKMHTDDQQVHEKMRIINHQWKMEIKIARRYNMHLLEWLLPNRRNQ